MGLFNVFKGSKYSPRTDLIWQNQQAKAQGCVNFLSKNKVDICVAWFEETQKMYQTILGRVMPRHPEIVLAKTLFPYSLDNKNVLFLEHYPLFSKEENLVGKAKPVKVWFVTSLDDALLSVFSGNVVQLMQRLGMKEDECIEHKMIGKSIINAQKRIEKESWTDFSAKSGDEWMKQFLASKKKAY
jgi:hypothetical protein